VICLLFWCRVFGFIIDMMSLHTIHVWHVFVCGCNMLSIQRWLKKKEKIRSTIKTATSRNGTWASRIYTIAKMLLGFCPLAGEVVGPLPPPVALGLRKCISSNNIKKIGGRPQPLVGGWFRVLCVRLFFNVFFDVMRWWLHIEIRIRFSPSYPCFSGADLLGSCRFLCLLVWF
jgi:hypothetical protein